VVEILKDGAFRSDRALEHSLMVPKSILDCAGTVSTINPAAF
jgi:hypothetical protein